MPLQRCKKDGQNGWQYGQGGACYTGPGAKKKAIKQGIAIQENGGPKFESRKGKGKSKGELTEGKISSENFLQGKFEDELEARTSELISREEGKRDDLERDLMDRRDRLVRDEGQGVSPPE